VSQTSILTTARNMIDQGTYRSSACPYECSRRIVRHEVVKSNEANMLSGLGLLGEGFVYPGHADDPRLGFSRFPTSGETGLPKLHPLHMSHNVTLDQCDDIVHRHQLLSPHGVWLVHAEHEDGLTSAERLGDCGLFLGARSSVDADIWRAFYRYARLVLRLGHVDTWLDDDLQAAIVHSSAEGTCSSSTSKVCVWWSEFDLDDEEYSCRPKRDASNIITPAILLATLAENGVAYPPPNPPPPEPPHAPPTPSPPPGALRCELLGIASTDGKQVWTPNFNDGFTQMQQKCWRWDAGNDWPPFVAHRDLYKPIDRCGGARSRDVQWDGGFKQSLITKADYDKFHLGADAHPGLNCHEGHPGIINIVTGLNGVENQGANNEHRFVANVAECIVQCQDTSGCSVIVYRPVNTACYLRTVAFGTNVDTACVSSTDFDTYLLGIAMHNASRYQKYADELKQPSGPPFPSCFDDDVADYECCHAETQFRIRGGRGNVGQTDAEKDCYCADGPLSPPPPFMPRPPPPPTPWDSWCLQTWITNCVSDADCTECPCSVCKPGSTNEMDDNYGPSGCGNSGSCLHFASPPEPPPPPMPVTCDEGDCPAHLTSYHGTPTGCKNFCKAAFQRLGNDNTCMPGKPECANWLDYENFPIEPVTVNAECICGAKLEELQDSGKYVHTGTVLQGTRARARRILHEDAADEDDDGQWRWPDAVPEGIDLFHGAHLDASDACVAEIMSFRTDLLNNSQCDGYLDMGAGDIPTEWDPSNQGDHVACTEDGHTDDECCVVHRGEAQASRLWTQAGDMATASVSKAFARSSIVGTSVHTSRVAAVGDFNNDDFPDIVIGNQLYINRAAPLCTSGNAKRVEMETSAGRSKKAYEWYACAQPTDILGCNHVDTDEGTGSSNWVASCPVGSLVYCYPVATASDFPEHHATTCADAFPAGVASQPRVAAAKFDYQHGIQIGPKDFAQVYAGDIDGVAPDDVVAVYEDGSVEVFLTNHDPSNPLLAASGGVGFHSMGVVLGAGVATVTTVNFIGTLQGYGTTCRSKDFGCTSPERAVFLGTSDTDDYLFVSPQVFARNQGASSRRAQETGAGSECYANHGSVCRSLQFAHPCVPATDPDLICPLDYATCTGAEERWDVQTGVNCHPYVGTGPWTVQEWDPVDRAWSNRGVPAANRFTQATVAQCKTLCLENSECTYFNYDTLNSRCYIRKAIPGTLMFSGLGTGDPRPCDNVGDPSMSYASTWDHYALKLNHGTCVATKRMDFTMSFSPLANTRHRTLSSARFFTDIAQTHQALLIGTGVESPNALAYLGFPGFAERYVGQGAIHVETVAVAAKRVDVGVNLLCFANKGAKNSCMRMDIDKDLDRENKVVGDLQTGLNPEPNEPPLPPFAPHPSPAPPPPPPPPSPLPNPPPPPWSWPTFRRLLDGNDNASLDTSLEPQPVAREVTTWTTAFGHAPRQQLLTDVAKQRQLSESILGFNCDYEAHDLCLDEECLWNSDTATPPTRTDFPRENALFPVLDDRSVSTQECKDLCEVTADCNYLLMLTSCRAPYDSLCYMHKERDPGDAGVLGTSTTGSPAYQCSLLSGTAAVEYTRTCASRPGGGTSPHSEFGDVNEDTSDIAIAFLDDDAYPEVITSSERDHVRVYRGTLWSLTKGDFSSTVPETLMEVSLTDNVPLSPPPPPAAPHASPSPAPPPPPRPPPRLAQPSPPPPPRPPPCWDATKCGQICETVNGFANLAACYPNSAGASGCVSTGATITCRRDSNMADHKCWHSEDCPMPVPSPSLSPPAVVAAPPPPPPPPYESYEDSIRRLLDGNDDASLKTQPPPPPPPPPPPLPPQRRLLFGAYSRFPGDARNSFEMANVQQIFVRDFDEDGKMDLFLHAPALSPGSCAQRCHSLGRFGARQPHLYTLLGP
jgi:hypothetical protein